MFFLNLVSSFSEDSSYGTVVESGEIVLILLGKIPRLTAPEEGVKWASDVDLRFDSFVDVFVVEKLFGGAHY